MQVASGAVNSRGRLSHVRSLDPIRSSPVRWTRRTATVLGAVLSAAGIVGLATWVGCSIYNPSLLVAGAEESGADVIVEAGTRDADAAPVEAGPSACPEVFPPAAPTADDPSDAGDQSVVLALHTIELGFDVDSGAAPLYGYDLDQVFTCCEGGVESCTAAASGATHCDELEGRDNSGGQLIAKLASQAQGQFSSATISQRLQSGVYSIIVQLLHYNGQPNDTQVTAVLYTSDGIEAVGDAAPPPAKWDGTDVWTLDQSSVLVPDASPIVGSFADGVAYVSGGVLVMHINFPISLGTSSTGSLSVSLTGGVITGNVVPVGNGSYRLQNGQIAGRWQAATLLSALQQLTLLGQSLCRGQPVYEAIKTEICQSADIMSNPSDDKMGKTCDALSLAFGFTADPANMGDVVSAGAKASLCLVGEGGDVDAAPDDCTMP